MVACKLEFSFRYFKRINLSFYCRSYIDRCMLFSIFHTNNMLIERYANSIWEGKSRAIGRFASMITNFSSCLHVFHCSKGWWMKMCMDLSNLPYYLIFFVLKAPCAISSQSIISVTSSVSRTAAILHFV